MTIYNFENISKIVFVKVATNRLCLRIRGFENVTKAIPKCRENHAPLLQIDPRTWRIPRRGLFF